jgi:hypothetical protein
MSSGTAIGSKEVLELARNYPYVGNNGLDSIRMGVDLAAFPDGEILAMKSRLPGDVWWRDVPLSPSCDSRSLDQSEI